MRAGPRLPPEPPRRPQEVYEAASRLDPFQVLTAEHALLRLELSRAIETARADSGGVETRRALAVLLNGFRMHQTREDVVMYPVCERLFGGRDGPAAALREEHELIRLAFDKLAADAERPRPASAEALEEVRQHLEAHFVKEERVLFPLMMAHLQGREIADLARRLRSPDLD